MNLRISLVTETYFPQVNGVSRTLDRLVRFCAGQGDRILLLIPRYPDNANSLPPGVEKSDWSAVPLPFYREVVLPMVTADMVGKVLSAFRPDIVHIATEGPLGRVARKKPLPVDLKEGEREVPWLSTRRSEMSCNTTNYT